MTLPPPRRDHDGDAAPLLEERGALGDLLPDLIDSTLPLLAERNRNAIVWMLVTTGTGPLREQFYAPSHLSPDESGRGAAFRWKARGSLPAIIRQFRLGFLRQLTPLEYGREVAIIILAEPGAVGSPMPAEGALTSGDAARGRVASVAAHAAEPSLAPQWRKQTAESPSGLQAQRLHPSESPLSQLPHTARIIDAASPANEHDDQSPQSFASPESAPNMIQAAIPAKRAARTSNQADDADPRTEITHPIESSLYQDFFGFERMPFNNTPDTFFYFPTEKHQEALSRLVYAISERKGFVMISGEIGAGKSTLCRTLLAQMPREVHTALITHTHLDGLQLLHMIAEDLGLDTEGMERPGVLRVLNEFLVTQLAAGHTVCIIIDEAQNLSPEALEEVRMISNLETEQEKLVQLILLGQPNLRETIQLPELRQLRQRISVQYHLEPLSQQETYGYILHRLKKASPVNKLRFPRGAMREVFRYSGGVPRIINTLCDNALLSGFTRQTTTITPKLVREAATDLALTPVSGGLAEFFKFW